MSELPSGWVECEMGDISKVVGGGTPDSQDPESFSTDDGIPWLTPADLSGNKAIYITRGKRYLTGKGFENSSARLVPSGTVLFSSRAPIGYVAIAANEICTNQGFKSFVCGKDISSEYIYFWLRFATPMAEALASGTTFAEISGKNSAKIPLRLAPYLEQRRIAAKLEALLGKVDACQQRLEKIPVLLKRFRQSVLAAACSGRLTADWREENDSESAPTLIARIRAKRAVRFQDVSVRDDMELPEIPESWCWTNLRFLLSPAEAFCYGVVQPGANDPEGAFLVRAGDLVGGRVDTGSLRRIPISIHSDYRRSQLLGGEILVTVVGAGIGQSVIAQPECAGFNIARAVAKLPVREFNARYVHLWLQSGRAVGWMKGDSREVARPTLNLEQLQTLPVPIAPLREQDEIVRRVGGLFTLADKLEARLTKAREQVDQLTPSLLARAFAGKLVPQDPNDEPAEKLLERIGKQQKIH